MDNALMQRLLAAQLRARGQAEITVTGVSMNPTLYEGDRITLSARSDYEPGDILVFTYKHGELLVHRLLDKQDGRYICKGDNAFRLEDITLEQIFGKVAFVTRDGEPYSPEIWRRRPLLLSLMVGRAFVRCRYDLDKVRATGIYRLYERIILRKEEIDMLYKKNESMDYIPTDDTSLAVFDPDSGDTHFFDETGVDILNLLSEPRDLEGLLAALCGVYAATPEEIRPDVEAFLEDCVSKKVVEAF